MSDQMFPDANSPLPRWLYINLTLLLQMWSYWLRLWFTLRQSADQLCLQGSPHTLQPSREEWATVEVAKHCKGSRRPTVTYNDPFPGTWSLEGSCIFQRLAGWQSTPELVFSEIWIKSRVRLHSSSLRVAASSQLKTSRGKVLRRNKKDTALIKTNTRPWLSGARSDWEESSWDRLRESRTGAAFALSQNCIRNPINLWRRQEGKNTFGPRRIVIAAHPPVLAVQRGDSICKMKP